MTRSDAADPRRVTERAYRGVWAILRDWFRVPDEPPSLPHAAGQPPDVMRPAPGYLRYLTFQFWLLLIIIDVALIGGWIIVCIANPVLGAIIAVPVWLLAIVPDIVAYVGIHLRYDTTWYVISDRSMRIRRGVWVVQEVTITFDNIQNVSVSQGPLQRHFGIATLIVQTAGGGSSGPHGTSPGAGHMGLLEGVDNADALREKIMARVRASRGAGLGEERHHDEGVPAPTAMSDAHLALLREIRDASAALRSA